MSFARKLLGLLSAESAPIVEREMAMIGGAPVVAESSTLQIIDRSPAPVRKYLKLGEEQANEVIEPRIVSVLKPNGDSIEVSLGAVDGNVGEIGFTPINVQTNIDEFVNARIAGNESIKSTLVRGARSMNREFSDMWNQFRALPATARAERIAKIMGASILVVMVAGSIFTAYILSDHRPSPKAQVWDYDPEAQVWKKRE